MGDELRSGEFRSTKLVLRSNVSLKILLSQETFLTKFCYQKLRKVYFCIGNLQNFIKNDLKGLLSWL